MRSDAVGQDRFSTVNIRGRAICSNCGKEGFHLAIYAYGSWRPYCIECGESWSPPARSWPQDLKGYEAVGSSGDVAGKLVSEAAETKFDRTAYQREYMRKWRKKEKGSGSRV